MHTVSVPNLRASGFTGTMAYTGTMDTVFQGTSPKESYLILNVLDNGSKWVKYFPIYLFLWLFLTLFLGCCVLGKKNLASNWHFPANFTEVDLPFVKVVVSNVSVTTLEYYSSVSVSG